MRKWLLIAGSAWLIAVALGCLPAAKEQEPEEMKIAAPEITDVDEWINTKPLLLKDLRGKVVVLHFWTFG
jgi:hypothetical protein